MSDTDGCVSATGQTSAVWKRLEALFGLMDGEPQASSESESVTGMVQTTVDDRIPMSPALQASLMRARDYASQQSHTQVTLEHLLLALTEDDDASSVLQSCRIDLERLRHDVSGHIGSQIERSPNGGLSDPGISVGLTQILKYATLAAKQGRRPRIDGAIVLAAIVGDERSMAAAFLKAQGLTFEEAIRALQQVGGSAARRVNLPSAPPESGQARFGTAREEPGEPPSSASPSTSGPVAAVARTARTLVDTEDLLAAARARVVSRGVLPHVGDTSRSSSEDTPQADSFFGERPARGDHPAPEPPLLDEPATSQNPAARPETVAVSELTATSGDGEMTSDREPDPELEPERAPSAAPPSQIAPPPPPKQAAAASSVSSSDTASPPGSAPPRTPTPAPPSAPASSPRAGVQPPPLPWAPPPLPTMPRPPPPQVQVQAPPARPPSTAPAPSVVPPPVPPSDPRARPQPDRPPERAVQHRNGSASLPRAAPYPPGFPPGPPPAALSPGYGQRPPEPQTGPAFRPPGFDAAPRVDPSRSLALSAHDVTHSIPDRLHAGVAHSVEVRVARPMPTDGSAGPRPSPHIEMPPARAVSVRLRSSADVVAVVAVSPETHWDKPGGANRQGGDVDVWRFLLIPSTSGHIDIGLDVTVHAMGLDGHVAERALPEQIIPVRVGRNAGRILRRVALFMLTAIGSIVILKTAEEFFQFDTVELMRRLSGL